MKDEEEEVKVPKMTLGYEGHCSIVSFIYIILYVYYMNVCVTDNMDKLRVNLCDMDLVGLFGEKIS